MQQLPSCAGKPCPQHTFYLKASHEEHDAKFVLRLVAGQPQAFVPGEHDAEHFVLNYSKTYSKMWTPIWGNVLLSSWDGKGCPCQGIAGLVGPRGQCVRAHVGVCPRQHLGGVKSRADGRRDEQAVGIHVRWVLNTKCQFPYPLQRREGHA